MFSLLHPQINLSILRFSCERILTKNKYSTMNVFNRITYNPLAAALIPVVLSTVWNHVVNTPQFAEIKSQVAEIKSQLGDGKAQMIGVQTRLDNISRELHASITHTNTRFEASRPCKCIFNSWVPEKGEVTESRHNLQADMPNTNSYRHQA